MSNRNVKRLPGIESRFDFTMRYLKRTLHKVGAARAKLGLLESIALDLEKLAVELEKKARPVERTNSSEAVKEFVALSDWIYGYCEELSELLTVPPVRVLAGKAPEAEERTRSKSRCN